ncbi:hypothetical protein M427DRAFT_38061 [Gonapodya prolifera JEL478]|uniref:Cytochrome c oxidase assembly factor 5 n=1 Tax=Gonapodya prolifera (strain JEL478) TaxID=1344416 RepID=A0A138ZZL8_GONPJ|nr:hypothetical protein M427DRAFT_38061 [Gonapodya prolifera JEL478]|eukprot:KXS09957.1 hypothetical protein M427DRAFT_38061 [Gonapodya prolifera JEL478]
MPSSCKDLRQDLLTCLAASPCITVLHKTPTQCLREGRDGSVPDDCFRLYRSFVDCKRGLWDMRKRFRGNAPAERYRPDGPAVGDVDDSDLLKDLGDDGKKR